MKLSRIIKFIRESSALSQEDFATKVGVARLAVVRWENEKAAPNKLAQTKMYEIAKEKGINIYDFIVKDLPGHKIENNKAVLYHGSKSGIEGEIKPLSRERCDFGQGFYMGTQVQQPLTLISTHPEAMLYVVEFDLNNLKAVYIPTDIEWAMLVAYSRGRLEQIKGTKLYEKYKKMLEGSDAVVGSIANDRMFFVLDRFFAGAITDKGLVESLSALQLGTQYVALSEKACKQIKIISVTKLSELERLCLDDISESNREYGVKTANEICKSYRREGKFFDEILKESIDA
jgi:transcriptional regulator with XRE-family HTH domain